MTKCRIGIKAHTLSGAAALIIAVFLTLLFTGCPNAHGNKLATPKYQVTFSVDGAGGTLKAKADGETEINSGDKVEHGKTVTFTATPAAGYRVKGWTLDDNVVNGTAETYTLAVTQSATITVSFEPKKALLTLEAGKNTVKVKAKTADGKPITVEGCTVNELANEAETTLTVTDSERKLALIGDIIELDCRGEETTGGNRPLIALDVSGCTALQKLNCQYNKIAELDVSGLTALQELDCNTNQLKTLNVKGLTALQELSCSSNQLTELNVQGLIKLQQLYCSNNQLTALNVQSCTALKKLECFQNKLNADAFTKLFNDLPAREVSDKAKALLYVDRAGVTEENCTNFSTPESLKKAFENARDVKHWKMQKANYFGFGEDI